MIKLIRNKKFLFLFCGLLLAFLFFFKTPSLAQSDPVCPSIQPRLEVHPGDIYWDSFWFISPEIVSANIKKTSGASLTTGLCYSQWNAYFDIPKTGAVTYTNQMFCGCNNVGFTSYSQIPGCPDVVSNEVKADFGGCSRCARADFNYDNAVNDIDHGTMSSLYASCLNCTSGKCNWSTCGKIDINRDGVINLSDDHNFDYCNNSTFCWCGTRPPDDVPAYVCEGRYFGQPQCKAKAISHPQGACVLDPKWGKIDPRNPLSSTNYWKWTYCYPEGQTLVSVTPAPTTSLQKVCEGKYFGEPQCRTKVTPKPGYSCQFNPALGLINASNLSDSINYWKWSYCKN